MPIIIDGVKYMMSELEGTDIKAIHDFMNKSKSKCAIMFYVDDEGEIQTVGTWKTKKARDIMDNQLIVDIYKH